MIRLAALLDIRSLTFANFTFFKALSFDRVFSVMTVYSPTDVLNTGGESSIVGGGCYQVDM